MTQKQKKERLEQIANKLEELYPDAVCALEWEGEPWKLLIMGRLSAQCTDARVNTVCKELFTAFPTPQAIAEADIGELEHIIRPCGLYRVKAQNTKDACILLINEYNGILPDSMEELLRFPGVGRKVANLLLGDIYGKGGVVADTHCMRICGRFGMYREDLRDPVKIERLLTPLLPPEKISDFCHRIVLFGRDVCNARSPACMTCPLLELCEHGTRKEKKA
ncbi:MAG: endonuclease III [Ruminococcaceae bacterium]|nr:endonuclease III [Oscillospiraceae bacterium]